MRSNNFGGSIAIKKHRNNAFALLIERHIINTICSISQGIALDNVSIRNC
ncbi:hypothetical protein [Sodalis endosymbiont of Henestaris halophilus]|nr:hypothetical protein [Sodalis endosymbiont of Henestaris halophilus]